MPSTHLNLREDDVVRLALEFLHNRDLHITQLSLERETGVINGSYNDDILFLRQLILDGQWDDVLEFIQPLSALKDFEANKFNYAILRQKYIELLCIRAEIQAYNNVENLVAEIVKVLSNLEKLAPSKEEYSNLCLLLTLPSITEHTEFKKWNPSNARVQCFQEVYPLVEQFLPCEKKPSSAGAAPKCAKNDRLMQLLIKGILYESCVNYCQAKATGSKEAQSNEVQFSRILDGSGFDESDLSLLSWLQSIPSETFSVPFEQRMLNVDVEKLERPSLHTSWTEHMLVTPIKPRTFPHLAMPFRRPRSAADAMTRSLRPLPDGVPRHPAVMAMSAIDYGPSSSYFAGFHLTGIKDGKLMNTSVDRLFTKPNDETFSICNGLNDRLKVIQEQSKPIEVDSPSAKSNEVSSVGASNATTPEHRGQDDVAPSSNCNPTATDSSPIVVRVPHRPGTAAYEAGYRDFKRDLMKQYQIQKKLECDDYLRNLCSSEMRAQNPVEKIVNAASATSSPINAESPSSVNQQNPHQLSAEKMGNAASVSSAPVNVASTSSFKQQKPHLQLRKNDLKQSTSTSTRNGGAPSALPAPAVAAADLNGAHPSCRPVTLPENQHANPSAVHTIRKHTAIDLNKTFYFRPDGDISPTAPGEIKNDGNPYILALNTSGDPLASGPHDNAMNSMSFNSTGTNFDRDETRNTSITAAVGVADASGSRPTFKPVTVLEDLQVVRCAEFHPNGKLYAVGANTKTLRICTYPKMDDANDIASVVSPTVLLKRTKHHKGSIYCLAWSPAGDLLATGSNDKSVKLMRFNSHTCKLEGQEVELTIHDGTVRDVCFIEDTTNKTSLLVSGGAGDCKIYVTDCATGKTFQSLTGHSGQILSLYNWGGAMFVSGSQDRTARFWDLRVGGCVNVITPPTGLPNKGLAVASVAVDPSGRLLVCGHEDGACGLHDVRGSRPLQRFAPHTSDVRSVRFSPGAYYLLTAGYDGRIVLTDMQGDLTCGLPSVLVARHPDKVITARWHPEDFSFLSTSADKTAVLWTIPPA